MTGIAWVFAAMALGFGVTDWWATWNERKQVRYVAKPATLVGLIGVAATLEPFDETIRTWMLIGLVLSLLGDIFLMLPEKWFVGGLASFLLGHIAYVVAMQQADRSVSLTLVGLAVVIMCVVVVGRRIVKQVAESGSREMVAPVIAYVVIISAMVVSAFGTAAIWAIIGAGLFYISDATLAWNRFVEKRRFGPLTVMITYHCGQAGLVAWLATG